MAMLKANTDCTNSSVDELGQLVNLFDASTLIRESRSYLVDENGTGQTSATNESTLLSTNSDIVSDLEFHKRLVSLPPSISFSTYNGHADGMFRLHDGGLLLGKTLEARATI
jgi:hypothetical protein